MIFFLGILVCWLLLFVVFSPVLRIEETPDIRIRPMHPYRHVCWTPAEEMWFR